MSTGRTHLDDVGLSYFGHMARALSIGGRLLGAGLACLVHAIAPGLFVDRASRTVATLHREMSEPHGATPASALAPLEAEA